MAQLVPIGTGGSADAIARYLVDGDASDPSGPGEGRGDKADRRAG